MSRREIQEFLRRTSIFEALDDTDIKILASSGHSWFFGKGESIVKQGKKSMRAFFGL